MAKSDVLKHSRTTEMLDPDHDPPTGSSSDNDGTATDVSDHQTPDSPHEDSEESSMYTSGETESVLGSPIADSDVLANVKYKIRNTLEGVVASGSFACVGSEDNPCNPGLVIDGYRAVGLPLSQRDALGLIEVCGQNSGRTGAANSWDFTQDQIKLENPGWKAYFDGLLQKVEHDLGLTCAFQAELCTLSLQQKGSMSFLD
jgi:hypothetical protein